MSWVGRFADDGREVSVAGALGDSELYLGREMIRTGTILEGLTNVIHLGMQECRFRNYLQ